MAALAGKLLDKKGARLPIIIGIIASLTSLILMNVLAPLSNLAIVLLYVLYYSGYGMCFGSLMTSGLITLGKASHAQGNAIFNTYAATVFRCFRNSFSWDFDRASAE